MKSGVDLSSRLLHAVIVYVALHVFWQLLPERKRAKNVRKTPSLSTSADEFEITHFSNRLLCGEKRVAASPAAFDRLQIGVGVIADEVLQEMLRHAEDQGATLPLQT